MVEFISGWVERERVKGAVVSYVFLLNNTEESYVEAHELEPWKGEE